MVRLGSQHPTFHTVGTWASSDGDRAISLFNDYGVEFYESQAYELRLFLSRDEEDRFACRTIAISKPRQNGKSFAARYYSLWMAGVEGKKVLYSAHHAKTVRKMFKAIKSFIKANPDWVKALVPGAGIYSAEGREGIYFANGGMIEFATRTNAGGRGETYDIIVIDEAQELTDEEYDALTPTTIASESGDPQKIYIGTPPNEKCPGTVFRGLHDKAHAGKGGNVWWLEWAAEKLGDVHDVDLWYATNPALGYRIKEDVFADAADSATSIDGFFREYLGWWSEAAVFNAALSSTSWALCATEKPPEDGVVSYGVKFTLDGKWASLAACIRPEKGRPHVEVLQVRSTARGITALANWLIERKGDTAQITIDGRAKAALLEKKLKDGKCVKKQVVVCQTKDITGACSMLEDMVDECSVTHFDQPGLNDSVAKSPKRNVSNTGGWAFDGDQSAPIESCALALYGAMTTKRNPKKKVRML